jgi:diguanylate cyclase (GGDEF)-like protein
VAAAAALVFVGYVLWVPRFMASIFSLVQRNNSAVAQLLRGDTQLEALPSDRHDEIGQMARGLMRLRDLTEDLRQRALRDPLTGLQNRAGLDITIDNLLDDAREQVSSVALVLLDIKRFRHLNHAFGMDTGDAALQAAATALQQALPAAQGLSRLQADRFALILPLGTERSAKAVVTEAVAAARQRLGTPITIFGNRLTLDARFGAAIFPDDGIDATQLMVAAEAALALCRRDSSDSLCFAHPELAKKARRTASVVEEIREGLSCDEFWPHYEPIVDLATGSVSGAEALARWQHPKRGLVAPVDFIPMAEDMGLIESLTSALLPRICGDLRTLEFNGIPGYVSVNLSARELNAGFVQRLAAAIENSGIDARRVTVELTETAMVERPDEALFVLKALKTLGVSLSLDDFGTGFSSLSYLQRFPIDTVKIDRSFVKDLPGSTRSRQIVEAILGMARSLHLGVVAEGVETTEQAVMLANMGCNRQQGYLYAKALPALALQGRYASLHKELGQLRLAAA